MIGLNGASGYDCIAALVHGLTQQELKLSRFVSTQRQASEVIALYKNSWPIQNMREPLQTDQRSWQEVNLDSRELVYAKCHLAASIPHRSGETEMLAEERPVASAPK
jgi:hypothetical protein